jgi:DNA anti-recombination protein RmuC
LRSSHFEQIKKLEEKYSKQKADIEAFNELRAIGIDEKRMRQWHQIIKTSNLDFGSIEGELRNQANLKALEDKISSQIKELVTEELRLNQSISNLNREKQVVESSVKAIRESALNEINTLSSKIMSSLSSLNDQTQAKLEETAQRSIKTLDEISGSSNQKIKLVAEGALTELKTTVSELKSSATDFSRELMSVMEQAAPEIKNVTLALDAGEKIGKYRNILPLLQLMDGSGNADESEALIAMWNLTSRFNSWVENHYPSAKKEISQPLSELLESINNEIQRVGGE